MKLRKDTTMERIGLSQEWREILSIEKGVDLDSLRLVRVSIPFEPEIYLSVLQDTDKVLGANRTYKGAAMRPGADVVFHLRANQPLWGATKEGSSSIAIICEYLE